MTRHFLVIGGQRCGTTFLHSLLEAHPDIAMARPARPEPKVFLSDEASAKGLDWYLETYFGHVTTETLLGEKSTSYIEDPLAPARAASVLGEPEIVALLRDPRDRAVSNWRFSTDNGLETRPLDQALRENLAGAREWDGVTTSVSPFAYLERGRYAEHLRPWFQQFPSKMHVVFFAELTAGPDRVGQLYAALGVDPDFRKSEPEQVNQSQEPEPQMSKALYDQLGDYFSDSDAELSSLLDRELPW